LGRGDSRVSVDIASGSSWCSSGRRDAA
jgi:hypothetical protein